MLASELKTAVSRGDLDETFVSLYGGTQTPRTRYADLIATFLNRYGDREVTLFSTPGRTEVSGNHTDHNHGKVLAASVNIDIIAVAARTDDHTVRIKSAGYREDIVDTSSVSDASAFRHGTSSAIIAGVCDAFRKNGYAVGGFVACTASDVLSGSGLSSSAAFEVLCGRILSELYNNGSVPPMRLAQFGQYAENVFFGKPCGLMDQAACACGGFLYIDFQDPKAPVTEKLAFDPEAHGYRLCILNTGGSHEDLTPDYAAVPKEMHAVAALLGKKTLRDCGEAEFLSSLPKLRAEAGDRAVLRALHFFAENKRVERQRQALKDGDGETFFGLVAASGNSSFKYLQNVFSPKQVGEQGVSLALALCEQNGAVCRVHGGGFAGTVQAYIPAAQTEAFVKSLEAVFGKGSCMLLQIRPYGASAVGPDGVRE